MIRPFNLRDLPLVHRLSEQGVSLHTESALIKNLHPTRGALFSLVGGDFPTYVWKSERGDVAGFIQLYLEEDSTHANVLYLSSTAGNGRAEPSPKESHTNGTAEKSSSPPVIINENAWLPLLDQAVVEAGQRGIHSLVAEVDETGEALPVLRRAGFVVYTRQDIWILHTDAEILSASPAKILNSRQAIDDWEIQLLYANTVPRLVQLVEPMPPLHNGAGWVLREEDELAAFVHVHNGSMATWMRLFIHPNAEAQAEEIITAVLQQNRPNSSLPVYCCVRRYQSWVQGALERTGFTLWGSQAVMVKHIVQHAQKPLAELSAALDAQGITPTAPIIRPYRRTKPNGHVKPKGTAV